MALTAVLFLVAAAMLAPGLVVGPSLDAAVFSHVGGRLLEGVAPYSGAWDHKPPGIYLATAAVRALAGGMGPWIPSWLLSLAASTGIGAAVAQTLRNLQVGGWPRSLASIGATLLASVYLLALGGGLTEPVATLFIAWALVLAVGRSTPAQLVAIGGLLGLSVLTSLQVLPGAGAVVGLLLVQGPADGRLRRAGLLALSFAAPLIVVATWLLAIGAVPAALDALVTYSASYLASIRDYGGRLGAPVVAWTVLVSVFLVAPAMFGALSAARAGNPKRALAIASLLWIGGSVVLSVVQGRFYAHYAIPLTVPLGALSGIGLERMLRPPTKQRGSAPKPLLALALTAPLLVSVVAGVVSSAMELAPVADANARSQAVADRLRHLPPGSILVWGNRPVLYELAQRAPATRFSYLYPLTTPGYSTPAMIQGVVQTLADDPPAVIVDAGSDGPGQAGFLPLLIDRQVATDGRNLDLLAPIRAFVEAHYQLAATVAGWPIYVLREDPAGSTSSKPSI